MGRLLSVLALWCAFLSILAVTSPTYSCYQCYPFKIYDHKDSGLEAWRNWGLTLSVLEIYCLCLRCKLLIGRPSHFSSWLSALNVELSENEYIYLKQLENHAQGAVANWDLSLRLSVHIWWATPHIWKSDTGMYNTGLEDAFKVCVKDSLIHLMVLI